MTKRHIVFLGVLLGIMIFSGAVPACGAEDLVIVGPEGCSSLQAAVDEVNAGGTILIEAGQYLVPLLSINKSVTIRSNGDVVLLAADDTANYGTNASWIRAESGCTVEFKDLALDGNGKKIYTALYGDGIIRVHGCSFTNIQYSSNKGRAIVVYSDDSIVEDCTFSQIGYLGIYLNDAQNILLQNNRYTGKKAGNHLDYAIEIANGAQALIRGNVLTDCTGFLTSNLTHSAAILISSENPDNPSRVNIECNNIIKNNLYGINIGLLANDSSQVRVSGNIITNNKTAVISTSREVSAEGNYWGVNGPVVQGTNAVPDWLDTSPWAADTEDADGDGLYDHLTYPLELQWAGGETELHLPDLEPGSTFSLSFTARLYEGAQETPVTYLLDWSAETPDSLTSITVNGTPLQQNQATLTDILLPGQTTTYTLDITIPTPDTYTLSLYGAC